MTKPLYVTPLRHTTRQAQPTMTDHRTTAETLIADVRVTARGDNLDAYAHAATAAAILDLADALRQHGSSEHAIDHAALQQHADRARAAFPGTYSPPPTYHHVLHTSEGGDTNALATDVPDGSHEHGSAPAPASCGHTWKGRNTLVDCRGEHTCAQPDTHPDGRHVCDRCGQTTPVDVCGYPGANGTCQRERGHDGVHYDEHGGVFATGADTSGDPDLHENLRRMTNRLRRSLGNLDIGAELPFNDVVSDLRHHVDAVVEELNEARR
ncbi:hypothetical protein SEA_JABBERWOCKY_56 [Gordonia phage Jabberwocky]|uniref:Uncharacterized protein n=1 Tax=Gordonia phage Jabberwocky TaxID=2653273 RepID=A0A5P8D5X4_9CAUD|nr:hypothetical protein KNU76_gp56 [Gordonia phage Jabberwocky]QFP94111.1 hypothetical protein SEA_JABBERWOCKY_56 [Gordonia phage Jabberwocky]